MSAESQWLMPVAVGLAFVVVILLVWLFHCYGADRIGHPEEWSDKGKVGERALWLALTKEIKVPERQILRNLHVSVDGRTSEIDLTVISKKGIFVFECKNYGGRIYGDARKKYWIQYLGEKKSYFYSPLRQNLVHCENLRKYLKLDEKVPVVSMVSVMGRGKWKVSGLRNGDYLLGYNCHLRDIYDGMPDCELMGKYWNMIMQKLRPLERPDDSAV